MSREGEVGVVTSGMTSEEIRWRYVVQLREMVEQELRENDGGATWFGSILWNVSLEWPSANYARIVWPIGFALTSNELDLLGASDVVWCRPSAGVDAGRLVVEVLLVDEFNNVEGET